MSLGATASAVAVSLGALACLAATDPKRRRAFRLPPTGRRHAGAAWALALAPGALLPFASGAGGFCVWLGAVAVGGWAIAATPPGPLPGWPAAGLGARVAPVAAAGRAALRRALSAAAARRRAADRLAGLERRVRELEAELAARRGAAAAPAGRTTSWSWPARPLGVDGRSRRAPVRVRSSRPPLREAAR